MRRQRLDAGAVGADGPRVLARLEERVELSKPGGGGIGTFVGFRVFNANPQNQKAQGQGRSNQGRDG